MAFGKGIMTSSDYASLMKNANSPITESTVGLPRLVKFNSDCYFVQSKNASSPPQPD